MKRLTMAFSLIGLGVLFLGQTALAQDPNFTLRFSEGVGGASGGTATITCFFDFPSASDNVAGWSLGVCHDETTLNPLDAVMGATTSTIQDGSPPAFQQINIVRNGDEEPGFTAGVNHGVVISFLGASPLPPGSNFSLLDITYELEGPDGAVNVSYCDTTLGSSDAVVTVIAIEGGTSSIIPVQLVGSIEIGAVVPPTLRIASDLTIDGSADASVFLDHVEQDVYGFSFGVAHDPAVVTLTGIARGAQTTDADFFGVDIDPANGDGGTVGCVLSLSGGPSSFIPTGVDSEVAVFSYDQAAGASTDDTSALAFTDTLQVAPGAPPVLIQVSTGLDGIDPDVVDGLITVTGGSSGTVFTRGDANDDSTVDLSDTVYILNFLFVSGPALNCEKAGDVNDDSALDLSDSVYVLNFLFVSGPAIPAPLLCGADPTADTLTCVSSSCP